MSQKKDKPWVRWLYLACAVIWLVNLAVRLSDYLQRLGRGVPPEQLARARLDCIIAGLIVVLWLVAFLTWRMDQKKPAAWLVRLLLMAAVLVGWVVIYPLMAAGGFDQLLWWTALVVMLAVALYLGWKCWSTWKQTKSPTQDQEEMI